MKKCAKSRILHKINENFERIFSQALAVNRGFERNLRLNKHSVSKPQPSQLLLQQLEWLLILLNWAWLILYLCGSIKSG